MSKRGSAKAWVLAFVLTAGLGLGAFIGIGCLVGANTCPGSSAPKQTSTDGQTLYLANCAFCHGRDGRGQNGPSLASGTLGALSQQELENRIADGKPLAGMPKFERSMTPQQIEAIAAYVVELRGGAGS